MTEPALPRCAADPHKPQAVANTLPLGVTLPRALWHHQASLAHSSNLADISVDLPSLVSLPRSFLRLSNTPLELEGYLRLGTW